jgi:multidrug efflux system membrane fusion protein
MALHFKEGDMVKTGDLLAVIDPRPYQVMLTQAEGQMARDQALLVNARVDLERYKVLVAQDSIEKQRLDTQAALVRQYEGNVKADQGAVDNAKLQLVYSRVTAPASGRLGLRQVDPGNVIRSTDANGIVTITQVQPINVVFTIPEDNLGAVAKRLRDGAKLPVEAYDRDGKTKLASGELVSVDNQIDPTTGTVKLKGQFANKDEALFPNQFVNVRLLLDTRHGATVIPSAAVQRGSVGTYVYVVKDDKTVTVRQVKLGPVDGSNVAVESGVATGEVVVTDGSDKLREGAKVDIAGRSAAPGAGGQRPDGAAKGERKGKGDWKGKRGEGEKAQ